jgi:hypothetical protein
MTSAAKIRDTSVQTVSVSLYFVLTPRPCLHHRFVVANACSCDGMLCQIVIA